MAMNNVHIPFSFLYVQLLWFDCFFAWALFFFFSWVDIPYLIWYIISWDSLTRDILLNTQVFLIQTTQDKYMEIPRFDLLANRFNVIMLQTLFKSKLLTYCCSWNRCHWTTKYQFINTIDTNIHYTWTHVSHTSNGAVMTFLIQLAFYTK